MNLNPRAIEHKAEAYGHKLIVKEKVEFKSKIKEATLVDFNKLTPSKTHRAYIHLGRVDKAKDTKTENTTVERTTVKFLVSAFRNARSSP